VINLRWNESEPDRPDSSARGGFEQQLHDVSMNLGRQSERVRDLETARLFYETAIRAQPESAAAWYNYGDVLLAMDRFEEAVPALSRAVELAPNTALYRYDLGLAYYQLGQYQNARRQLAPVVLEDPNLIRASSELIPSAMINLALTEDRLRAPLRGAGILRPALKHATKVIYNLGRLYLRGGKPNAAIPFFEACVALHPEDEPSVHGLGSALLDVGRHADAIPHLQRATRLDPACENARYDLGVCYAALKKHRSARTCFRKTLQLKPGHFWSYYGLACLDALENRPAAAFRNLEKSVACGFNQPNHIRRDADLKSLRVDPRWKRVLKSVPGRAEGGKDEG